jgi:hypothetical protein
MVQKTRRAIYFERQEKKGTYVKVEGRAWLAGSSYCAKFLLRSMGITMMGMLGAKPPSNLNPAPSVRVWKFVPGRYHGKQVLYRLIRVEKAKENQYTTTAESACNFVKISRGLQPNSVLTRFCQIPSGRIVFIYFFFYERLSQISCQINEGLS